MITEQVTLIMSTVKNLVPRVSGFLSNRDFEAGLVVRARAAEVSMVLNGSENGLLVRGDGGYECNGDGGDVQCQNLELEELANGVINTTMKA